MNAFLSLPRTYQTHLPTDPITSNLRINPPPPHKNRAHSLSSTDMGTSNPNRSNRHPTRRTSLAASTGAGRGISFFA
ncbi:hypothetical protein BP00DRAFT_422203 [Aspergillus indologenus CBS 114.80]|uniref:Uncharacterized protein n=1 Tax=Aspergillus indologenus CBS 114.80 TaxID=1450541 RepID=A0A2V5JAC4_9EURO|nr:hypothetical protein BP00DRAFT_422203 [Aspergillus indologenus CBS 114.80]